MNKNRPVNLDLKTIRMPITAYVSILHRVSGVLLLGGLAVLLCMLDSSLASEESFEALKSSLGGSFYGFVVWIVLSALAYHFVFGVRHLLMDFGLGESLEGGIKGAKIGAVCAAVLILLAGVWVW